ncbi:hypothetical protein BU15DRAFT_61265 [Melanogaster broomeanus]|nr:hypothetical protein BU15DRAFT_61265 [Melanogaster broomeanus]
MRGFSGILSFMGHLMKPVKLSLGKSVPVMVMRPGWENWDSSMLSITFGAVGLYFFFKRYKGRTPTPSSHSSRLSFDIVKDVMSSGMTEAATQHQVAKRKGCLTLLQHDATQNCGRRVNFPGDPLCSHLPGVYKYEHFWQRKQQNYGLKFEPTDIPDKYNICWSEDWLRRASDALSTVQFTTPDPEEFSLPSPTYLHIHAACAKVAKLSGAGDYYIDKLSRDLEEIRVLSEDGSSAELLEHALLPLSSEIRVF